MGDGFTVCVRRTAESIRNYVCHTGAAQIPSKPTPPPYPPLYNRPVTGETRASGERRSAPSPPSHPSGLPFQIAVTNCPRSQHYFWRYSAAAAYLSTDSYFRGLQDKGKNLLSKNISALITLKCPGRRPGVFKGAVCAGKKKYECSLKLRCFQLTPVLAGFFFSPSYLQTAKFTGSLMEGRTDLSVLRKVSSAVNY